MSKLMMLAMLVAAAPAMAQTVEGDVAFNDGDDNTYQTATAEQVQYSFNVLSGDVTTDTYNTIGGDVGNRNAIGGNVDQSLSNESSQVLQQAQADDDSVALNGNDLFFSHYFFWWF